MLDKRLILIIMLAPLIFVSVTIVLNPSSPDNTERVVTAGTQVIADAAVPWWIELFKFGIIGVVLFVAIVYFLPNYL